MGRSKEMAMEMAEKEAAMAEKAAMAQTIITREENGDNVHSALLAIQLGLKAPKDKTNDYAHFNYRTAGQILERVKPFLAESGCIVCVDDDLVQMGDRYYIHSTVTLHHIATGGEIVSNGYAREDLTEKGKAGAQMTGSSSTYAKKYALCNLFAIDDSSEDPDERDVPDRAQMAINALASARSRDEVETIKNYFADVLNMPEVIEAGKACKIRLGY